MKRLLVILLFIFSAFILAHAQEDVNCIAKMKQARVLYNQKKYKKAKEDFEKASYICGSDYMEACAKMIERCDKRLKENEKKRKDSLQLIEEKKAAKRMEKAALDRAARRESNQLVYLAVYCDVPGRFSSLEDQLKSNLHWTSNRDEAYWFMSVTVRNFELSIRNDFYSYRIEATIEVANAVELDFETKSRFVYEEGGCYVKNEDEAERIVADMLYEHEDHQLYKKIEIIVRDLIGLNDDAVLYKEETNRKETNRNNVVIYVDYFNSSIQRTSITETLQDCLRKFFKENGYIVKNNDKKINDIIRNYLLEEQGPVPPKEITPIKGKGVDKLCYVRVVDDNDNLTFFCQFIDLKTNDVLKSGRYPFDDGEVKGNVKVKRLSKKESIEVVAEVLAYQLGLLSDGQIKELQDKLKILFGLGLGNFGVEDKSLEEAVKKPKTYNSNDTIAFFESLIVPGLGQWLKGHEGLGAVTFLGEAALVCGAVYCHQMAQTLYNGFAPNTPVNIEDVNKYNSYARKRNWLVGAAVGTYAVNLVLAAALKPKNSDQAFVAPVLMPVDNTVALGMGLTFNF
jgi:hypothetical protein